MFQSLANRINIKLGHKIGGAHTNLLIQWHIASLVLASEIHDILGVTLEVERLSVSGHTKMEDDMVFTVGRILD